MGEVLTLHVDDLGHASDLAGSLGGGLRVVASHQHMHVAAALGGRGDGVERGGTDTGVVVFCND